MATEPAPPDALATAAAGSLSAIPLLSVAAGPRDGEAWVARLREEYGAIIAYVKANKAHDADWFTIASDKAGVRWTGRCWTFHNQLRYEVGFEFEVGVGYPTAPLEILVPELEGRTVKMWRGGR
jgi:ufm1-conjugating enzyme 1